MKTLQTILFILCSTLVSLPAHAAEGDTGDFVRRAWSVFYRSAELVDYQESCERSTCSESDLDSAQREAVELYAIATNLRDRLARSDGDTARQDAAIFGALLAMNGTRQSLDLIWGVGGGDDPTHYEQWCCGWPAGVKPGNPENCNKWCCKWEWGDPGQTCNDFKGDCTGTTDDGCNFFACNCSFNAG